MNPNVLQRQYTRHPLTRSLRNFLPDTSRGRSELHVRILTTGWNAHVTVLPYLGMPQSIVKKRNPFMRSNSSDIWFGCCMGGSRWMWPRSDPAGLWSCCGWQISCILRKCECQRLFSNCVVYHWAPSLCWVYMSTSYEKFTDDIPHTWFTSFK